MIQSLPRAAGCYATTTQFLRELREGKWASGGDCRSISPRSLDELAQHPDAYSPLFACDDCTFVNQCIAMQTAGLSALFFQAAGFAVSPGDAELVTRGDPADLRGGEGSPRTLGRAPRCSEEGTGTARNRLISSSASLMRPLHGRYDHIHSAVRSCFTASNSDIVRQRCEEVLARSDSMYPALSASLFSKHGLVGDELIESGARLSLYSLSFWKPPVNRWRAAAMPVLRLGEFSCVRCSNVLSSLANT